ncbi:molybdenum cofactor biosynthesis protein MoeA [Halodesulfurarchaeum formicicum]|uniref:Molybdenum cofactor biosynthesis protein MoeA n=1 Tax=Halodesulfurarchaeum formicicum TaxID=1873524 RepID=A0A1D8S2Q6_9EURY|nr:molybdopterin molybdotransferase MoeA [Halodesulfurarchaeum formicicum]AOW79611.1 molybdenum cofactor biosynthesis protein MoeA [Halodesulfurarchaeum formicicum]
MTETGPVRLANAISTLAEHLGAVDRTESVPLQSADGRVLAAGVPAERPQPHYRRATRDGYAVRAADTEAATAASPTVLDPTEGALGPGEAAWVHTGSAVPEGADAVVMVEWTTETGAGIEVTESVEAGTHVVPVGADLEAGTPLFEAGHRLRPGDLGALKVAGVRTVSVMEPPTVAVIPTGEELVQADPGPGQVVESNGLVSAQLLDRWGMAPRYREVVTDERGALREAIERDLDADLVLTSGGSSVGERDLLPAVVEDLGEVLVTELAVRPGHSAGIGVVDGTPIAMLPGTPMANLALDWVLVRPALTRALGTPLVGPPSVRAPLKSELKSQPGRRTIHGVSLDGGVSEASGHGLPSLSQTDGWVQVAESRSAIPAGESVTVEQWGGCPRPVQSEADRENNSEKSETR